MKLLLILLLFLPLFSNGQRKSEIHIFELDGNLLSKKDSITEQQLLHFDARGKLYLTVDSSGVGSLRSIDGKFRDEVLLRERKLPNITAAARIRPRTTNVGYIFKQGTLEEYNTEEDRNYMSAIYPLFLKELEFASNLKYMAFLADYYDNCDSCGSTLILHTIVPHRKLNKEYKLRKGKKNDNTIEILERIISMHFLEVKWSFHSLRISPDDNFIGVMDSRQNLTVTNIFKEDTLRSFNQLDNPILDYCFYSNDSIITINQWGNFSLIQHKKNSSTYINADFKVSNPKQILRLGNIILVSDSTKLYLSVLDEGAIRLIDTIEMGAKISQVRVSDSLCYVVCD